MENKETKNILDLLAFSVNKFSFSINKQVEKNGEVAIAPTLEITPKKLGQDDVFSVLMRVAIEDSDNIKYPFNLDVAIEGIFKVDLNSDVKTLIELNTVSILFPYMRAIITQITALAGIEPLYLPIINVQQAYQQYQDQNNKGEEIVEQN